MSEFFLIAEIKAVYDSNGFISLRSYSDFPERFADLEKVYIDVFGDKRIFFVSEVEYTGSEILLKFENFDSEEDTDFLVRKKIYVESEKAVKISEGTYFIHDLIGSKVIQGVEEIGVLSDVLNLRCHDVYVVKDVNDKEILIPAVQDFIKAVKINDKTVELIPGVDLGKDDED